MQACTRCIVSTDSGETKGSTKDGTFVCLNFARGCCALGYGCSWLHILPNEQFDKSLDITRDCFGRERHDKVRDDQSGVGSFLASDETARTLYVGGICITPDMQSTVYDQFVEWGEIENIRVLQSKGVAFVRYRYRSNAEFAKEAMHQQDLDNGEILNVRWATSDPNPWVVKRKEQENKRKLADTLTEAHEVLEISLDQDKGYPPMKRRQTGNVILSEAVGYFPNTDDQYELREGYLNTTDSSNYLDANKLSLNDVVPKPDVVQPRTLSDLVAWSKKQASPSTHCRTEQARTLSQSLREKALPSALLQPEKNFRDKIMSKSAVTSLVSEYDSSSDEEKEEGT